jgi:predicted Zn-dependent protease
LSKTAPDDPQVLNSEGAVELAQKKDNVKAAEDFARALKQGSEEPTTFLNLATALQNEGRAQEAEAVLERGVAAYPYSGALVARLAQQYLTGGQTWRARNLVRQYRAIFPEDPLARGAQGVIDRLVSEEPASPGRGATVSPPK